MPNIHTVTKAAISIGKKDRLSIFYMQSYQTIRLAGANIFILFFFDDIPYNQDCYEKQ